MKTAEAKTASTASQQKAYKPFFGKGGDSFMGNEASAKGSFFSSPSYAFIGNSPVQAKLTIGRSNDHYEKEADSMADRVVQRLAVNEVSRANKPAQISKCAACDAEEAEEKEKENVQKKEKTPAVEELKKINRKPIFESEAETPVQKKAISEAPVMKKAAPVNATITPVSNNTSVQAKCSACEKEKLQMQEGETEEIEKLQRKPMFATDSEEDVPIQRSCRECEEGDKVLMKPISGIQRSDLDRTPDADGSRTSIVAAAQGELGKVQARLNDGTGKRVGAERLLEYFHIAAPEVWDDSIIETAGAKMPSWCGIFSVWAHKKAGKDVGNWQMGKGVSAFGTLTQTDSPQPGDIGYIHEPNQHHALVKEVAGDTIHTIDGNSGLNSEVIENAKPRSEYSGFLTAFGGGSATGSVQSKGEAAAQGQTNSSGENTASDSVESRIDNTSGKGSSLPADTRHDMEQSFGADFGNVRIHNDSTAAQLSNDLQAHAFTHGSDIYFNSGKYDTDSNSGKKLLAHELTHVVQQGHAPDQVQRYGWDDFVEDVSDVADSAEEVITDTAEAIAETAEEVKDFAVETGEAAVEVVTDAASAALDWLKTTAGEAAKALVEHLGGTLTITSAGIEITFNRHCPIPMKTYPVKLKSFSKEKLWYVWAMPIGGDLLLTGQLGFKASIDPKMEVQVGPACLEGLHILINPFTSNYDISGGISTTIGVALAAEIRGGVKGQLGLSAVFPFPPFIATAPLVGLEGGLVGLLRGMAVRRMTVSGGLTYSGGTITGSASNLNEIGLGYDLFAGAYGQLDILDKNVCRLYWEPFEKHGSIAAAIGLSGDVSIIPGQQNSITPTFNNPTLEEIPFDSLPLAFERKGLTDNCPIKDAICKVLKELNLLPSQNGGKWDWAGTGHGGVYGPGNVLPGPNVVYERNPGIASSALCRGACGPDCNTCTHHPLYTAIDPQTGETWEYVNYEACKSNDGCREHDAAFDWAADAKGETGKWAIILPWHMAANMECTCNNVAGNCIAWIAGLPPYDMDMNFADSANRVGSGGPSGTSEEEQLAQCDRGELPPDYCRELYNRVIARFGNRERDLDLNPDDDVNEGRIREDDAPIMSSFRKAYNRMDSWHIFIHTAHPDFANEFDTLFDIKKKKVDWMDELKKKTKDYKNEFRDARTQDTEALRRQFLVRDLTELEKRITDLNLKMANWYKGKTGSTEDPNAIIERVHAEGTEMWRAAWRAAILAVNRILSRLWPPAKARIIGWVADQRNLHPGKDLSGDVGELDYVGSLAIGYKGAPKQFSRFNADKFDVDGNIVAPPLEKFAVNIMGISPDRQRIFAIGQKTNITPLINFCQEADRELKVVPGYDKTEIFDVVIQATNTASQQRSEDATARIYALRRTLSNVRYNQMVDELRTAGLLVEVEKSWQLKKQFSFQDNVHFNAILRRYE
jgi:hypothetical protein